ncbi:3-hydroxyisobutyrate dehydrogenase [Hyphomicrobiales bacterium]|jgi:3-hydroxyisobutyrate dehydrogenase|nr:3-hydroxyisobutyrate dehydrogenase [Hyphomicrobiales bacterium]|tara:strand:- start:501 stop:1394 length:894 start_codon:yes stop_codon:yes gene_type:complete
MAEVTFIGLGNMGLPMAMNLLKSGHSVTGFDLAEDQVKILTDAGGKSTNDINQAIQTSDVVVTMLPSGKIVKSIYLGDKGIIKNAPENLLLIDSSTIDVETAREVSLEAINKNLRIVDAPVSGGVGGAQAGTLTFMVGGEKESFDSAKEFLDIMGGNIIYAGLSGNGQAAKICNNMLLGISMIGTAEAFNLAENLGLDAQTFFDISSTASGQCWSMTSYCPVPGPVPSSPANNDYKPGFSAALMLKDLRLSQEAASMTTSLTPLGANATSIYEEIENLGQENIDFSGVIKLLQNKLK